MHVSALFACGSHSTDSRTRIRKLGGCGMDVNMCVCVCVLVCVCISCLALPLAAYSLILKRIRLPLLELWPKRTSHSHWLASCILKLAIPLALASAAGHLPMRCGGGESVSGQ